jgi:hypothetical protein
MDEVEIPQRTALGSFTISLNINGRTIQMSGYVMNDDNKQTLNERIDEYQAIIDRQLIRADTKSQEGQLKMDELSFAKAVEDFKKLTEKVAAEGPKAHSQDKAKLRNADVTLNAMKDQIDLRRKHIEENRKTLATL